MSGITQWYAPPEKQQQCHCKFISPRAPLHGGFFKRMVGRVKHCLRKTLNCQKIGLQELHTVVTEIESHVDKRPLTHPSDDQLQRKPLSQPHLMNGELLNPLASFIDEGPEDLSYVRKRDLVQLYKHPSSHKLVERRLDLRNLTALSECHGAKSPYNRIQLQLGDVLADSDDPCSEWPLGRIFSVHPDSQGVLRIVNVKCRGTTSLKTHEKLVPLELAGNEVVYRLPTPAAPVQNIRPERTAAQCKLKLIQYYNSEGQQWSIHQS
ncbi:uncharacterized protein [Procambarus clarkii]|uniref:uncharacterized protein n=1 Tax=Procambarus clarkii TaxID=6728 RepID=UPI003744A7EF